MNSEELEQSLKAEFESHLSTVIAEMKREAAEFQSKVQEDLEHQRSRMDEAFQGFAERIESKGGLGGGFGELVSEHLKLARDEGAKLAATAYSEAEKLAEPTAGDPKEFANLRDAVVDISAKDSQSTILKALVDHASQFAPRGAFFIIKNEYFAGWKVFGTDSDEDAARDIHFPMSSDSILGAASRSMNSVEGSFGKHGSDPAFLAPLNFGQPERMYAIPLVARGRGVAVLYADHGNDGTPVNMEALETLVKIAGLTVELLAAGQPHAEEAAHSTDSFAQEARAGNDFAFSESVAFDGGIPASVEQPSHVDDASNVAHSDYHSIDQHPFEAAPSFEPAPQFDTERGQEPAAEFVSEYQQPVEQQARPEHGFEPVREELAAPEFTPAQEYRPEPELTAEPVAENDFERAGSGAMFDRADPIPSAPESSPFERTVTPFEPAAAIGGAMSRSIEPAVDVATATTAPARSRLSDRAVDLPIDVPEDERRLHNDARRFARLLVSEIKLYNEKKVLEGRQAHDLYDRLKEAIDRSREMYDKRVQPPVAAKFDYFHYELLNSLADGDPQRFGSGYPGATI